MIQNHHSKPAACFFKSIDSHGTNPVYSSDAGISPLHLSGKEDT